MPGYRITALLGRGGFASVYEAVQESVGRTVALKLLTAHAADEDAERRFRAECRSIGQLSWHPHVVALFDAGFTEDERPFMAMEFLPGGSLSERLRRDGPMAPDEVARVGEQIADALAAAHEAGVVHRDVKPANILVGHRGDYLLGDFGIATVSDATKSATGTFSGTYAYCAPEVHRGERAGPRSDIFSLGVTLHALLTGRSPFMVDTDDAPSAVILRVLSAPAPPLSTSTPPALAAVIERAMLKDPADRFESAAELRDAVRQGQGAASDTSPSSIESVTVTAETVRRLRLPQSARHSEPATPDLPAGQRSVRPDPDVTRSPADRPGGTSPDWSDATGVRPRARSLGIAAMGLVVVVAVVIGLVVALRSGNAEPTDVGFGQSGVSSAPQGGGGDGGSTTRSRGESACLSSTTVRAHGSIWGDGSSEPVALTADLAPTGPSTLTFGAATPTVVPVSVASGCGWFQAWSTDRSLSLSGSLNDHGRLVGSFEGAVPGLDGSSGTFELEP